MPNILDANVEDTIAKVEALEASGVDVTAALHHLCNHAPHCPTLACSSTSVPHVHNVGASTTLSPGATVFTAVTPFAAAITPVPVTTITPLLFATGTLQEHVNSGKAQSLPPFLSQQRMLAFWPSLFLLLPHILPLLQINPDIDR
ncbi:hypothetical protein B0H16DRAFT_1735222 [Mycena metata]|uniref:Uncharacterized protein n=1 Tax=Mycena metata TaxID=1033252 RepID=A0AAD7MQF3_9AGAR|nr:hypothetical protein B0H16DRAFT_1735222 [Mycena metata]